MLPRIGGVGLQAARDWVVRFNSSGPAGLVDRKAPGKTALLTAARRSARAQAVEDGPLPWRDGVVRWRLVDLAARPREAFGITASRQTLGRELRRTGYRNLSARPQARGQDAKEMEAFKNFPAAAAEIRRSHARGRQIESGSRSEPCRPPSVRGPWRMRESARRP